MSRLEQVSKNVAATNFSTTDGVLLSIERNIRDISVTLAKLYDLEVAANEANKRPPEWFIKMQSEMENKK